MRRARCEGGKPLSAKVDELTQARLHYLAEFYKNVLGVDASNGALVRHALAALVDNITKLIERRRKDSEDPRLNWERMAIGWAARDNPAPWRETPPLDSEKFPTWREYEKARSTATPKPIQLEPFTHDDE